MVRLRVAGALLAGALAGGAGCERSSSAPAKAPKGVPEADVLARIDGQPITRTDLERQLADRTPFLRARYTAPEKRRELLDSLVRFEVLAREAESRGYGRDPDVLRYQKQRAIDRMVAEEIDRKLAAEPVAASELERYYREHPQEFNQAPAVRLDQIVVRDADKAKRVAAAAKLVPPTQVAGFRKLVTELSEDEDSKARAGDTTFLERDSPLSPKAVLEAGFTLAGDKPGHERIGHVAGPIATDRGFHIIRLSQVRAGFLRPLSEVEPRVRARVMEERRRRQIEAWVAEMRGRVKVEIFEDRLKEIKVGANAGLVGQDAAERAPAAPAAPQK